MRIGTTYYGDFLVHDELPFTLNSLSKAEDRIFDQFGTEVGDWPVTIDYLENPGVWEIWFSPPVSDEDYVKRMENVD